MKKNVIDLVSENTDSVLSLLLEDSILGELPLIGNIVTAFRLKKDVSNALFSKKLESFLNHLKTNGINNKPLDIKDIKKLDTISINMSLIIDNANSIDKPRWLAEAFISLNNGIITLDIFERVIYAIDIFSPALIKPLLSCYSHKAKPFDLTQSHKRGKEHYEELANLGLLRRDFKLNALNNELKVSYETTNLGAALAQIITKSGL
ncbi:hypothetical protein AAFX60_017205 [Aliivibrio fischeri]